MDLANAGSICLLRLVGIEDVTCLRQRDSVLDELTKNYSNTLQNSRVGTATVTRSPIMYALFIKEHKRVRIETKIRKIHYYNLLKITLSWPQLA